MRRIVMIVLLLGCEISSATALAAGAARTPPAAAAPAPCARGTWKDDPVCFGETDADLLPTPSAGSTGRAAKTGPTLAPSVDLNRQTSGPGVTYKHDGSSVTQDYRGGMGLQLPF